ncbi:hypothetical protein [Streptomyces sp. NPDC005181]|uniref:hypothetical protein n=1 Tax=Streptomyces sp. NPDC005181 TaxID=3156869 RepID=UPI0033B61949
MPTLMGAAIAADGGHGFTAGMSLLVATQLITLVSAVVLLARHRDPQAGQRRPVRAKAAATQSVT